MSSQLGPWVPYKPTPSDPWDLRKAAHLHRRAGFGATWGELQRDLRDGPAVSIDRLFRPAQPTEEEQQIQALLRQGVLDTGDPERLKAWWLCRMLYGNDSLGEKLTLFWHSHFATSNYKVHSVAAMLAQNELFRRQALGNFRELLLPICSDRAMLVWLDGGNSPKEKPNENFGREFLELFTLGLGRYTEKDIRAAARAFTGWVENPSYEFPPRHQFHFDKARFDEGEKTFLKQTGRWGAADIVRITLEQPACAEFLCRKLYRFFVSDAAAPPAELIAPLAEELRSHGYSIRHVVEIILRSRHFYGAATYRQRIKGPVEFSAGLVRVLEVPRGDVNVLALAAACERQGQDLFYPPNVKGWDGGRTWLTSTTLLERGNWVSDVVWGNASMGVRAFDPAAWVQAHGLRPNQTAAALVDLLLQGDLDTKARALIERTAAPATA
ncbi:MAG TPA: DUF1800 domain-containing protein, partial [Gemmataceae bacterium]|nr:DUF1800 domain-containing protein [Gemmataceae bacterium]